VTVARPFKHTVDETRIAGACASSENAKQKEKNQKHARGEQSSSPAPIRADELRLSAKREDVSSIGLFSIAWSIGHFRRWRELVPSNQGAEPTRPQ